jgi:hypothetical protein
MDMDMPISEHCLEYARDLCIDLLDTIESTLTHSSREGRDLINTNYPLIRDDEQIELVVHPREENKREKRHPKNTQSSPK